jgi:hypothetical protein
MPASQKDEIQETAVVMEQKELAKEIERETVYNIKDVEIFRVGKWNGDEYTEKDLDDIVESFDKIGNQIKPYLKLGHNSEQKLLQKDGMPAAGWVTDVRRKGKQLIANFKNVPKKIKELLDRKAYGRISAEIYWNLKEGSKVHRRVLKAVSLLGADTPAIGSLDDFINLYTENYEFEILKNYDILEDTKMDEKQVQELNNKVAELQKKLTTYEKENETLKCEIIEKEYAKRKIEVEAFLNSKVKEGKVLPSQVQTYMALALNNEEVKVYSYIEDNQERKIENDGFGLIKSIIDCNPALVEFSEKTHTDQEEKKLYSNQEELSENDKLDMKIQEYAKENKVEYPEAFEAIAQEGGK